MKPFDHRLNDSWWALRIALGLMPIVSGVDKFFNKLADWGMYLSPYATKVVPGSVPTFMHLVGIVEIVAGVIVLSRWTKIGSYIVMVWLIAIAANLITTGMFTTLRYGTLRLRWARLRFRSFRPSAKKVPWLPRRAVTASIPNLQTPCSSIFFST